MSDSVCQCCAAVEEMREHWKLIDCIKGGTSAMREAGEAYLPKGNSRRGRTMKLG
ncbi:TPA: hypothetical protein N0G49_000365 [Pseudomonas aeruginosa]|nr:hypothetical protein [Pseudomonas aeruginosa]